MLRLRWAVVRCPRSTPSPTVTPLAASLLLAIASFDIRLESHWHIKVEHDTMAVALMCLCSFSRLDPFIDHFAFGLLHQKYFGRKRSRRCRASRRHARLLDRKQYVHERYLESSQRLLPFVNFIVSSFLSLRFAVSARINDKNDITIRKEYL